MQVSQQPPASAPIQEDPTYILRPNFKQKFRPTQVQKLLHQILTDRLTGASYHPDTCSQWTREIADEIKTKLKDSTMARYKFIVHIVIGEKRGEGVRMATRCFYDADTDNVAHETFVNESLFCVAAAFGVFYY